MDSTMSTTAKKRQALIVEDEVLIAMVAAEALQEIGFTTVEVASAKAALQAVKRTIFDVALIDVGLPDRRGDELAAEVRTLHSELPIIIATGYSSQPLVDRFRTDRQIVILNKPYDFTQIQAAINTLTIP